MRLSEHQRQMLYRIAENGSFFGSRRNVTLQALKYRGLVISSVAIRDRNVYWRLTGVGNMWISENPR